MSTHLWLCMGAAEEGLAQGAGNARTATVVYTNAD